MSESEARQEGAALPRSAETQEDGEGGAGSSSGAARKRRRRGSRGGRNRSKPRPDAAQQQSDAGQKPEAPRQGQKGSPDGAPAQEAAKVRAEGTQTAETSAGAGEAKAKPVTARTAPRGAPVKPKIGDTLPPPAATEAASSAAKQSGEAGTEAKSSGSGRRRRGGRGRSSRGGGSDTAQQANGADQKQQQGQKKSERDEKARDGKAAGNGGGRAQKQQPSSSEAEAEGDGGKGRRRRRGGRRLRGGGAKPDQPVEAMLPSGPVDLDEKDLAKRRGRERKGRPVGRYLMAVHVSEKASQIAVLEGRSMIEHYVSRPADDVSQIHGNVYVGRVQNVLPGMEAAFVDIGTPKNAVLYRGDVQYDRDDVEHQAGPPKIEKMLKAGQSITCQVTKNPIGAKGARLTQEVSLPGRHVVLIPNSSTYGISKRLPDNERKRLRQLLDRVKPAEHGIIVRTAAEGATSEEVENDVLRLVEQWKQIESLAKRSKAPSLLYREPDLTVRVIREEFNNDYRSVVIDDRQLYESVRDYVASINPTLADRVEFYDPKTEKLPLFEKHHVHEQLHRALDRKVWLPSGGSLIIEHTEALTVIDVNTGKNVGRSSLEETVFKNNLEAAVEIARQLRLRDIGGIIVIDYIDMERRENRDEVVRVFREALSRDKTRTQVFEISELGLCEMTRKRIGEGLLESYSSACPMCDGRGVMFDQELLPV